MLTWTIRWVKIIYKTFPKEFILKNWWPVLTSIGPTLQGLIQYYRNFMRWFEIFFPKQRAEFSCRSCFIDNFAVKNHFSEAQNHQKLNISRPIYFKKNFANYFEDLIWGKKMIFFFFFFQKKLFSRIRVFSQVLNH